MSFAPGTRLGPYEIVSLFGTGGMGEVYRAHDTKLNRDVALKVLPEGFAEDAERIARFKREAQVLASLNHPHIAAIYGFEDSGSTHALVLELVEGPTLADRIAQGPLPLDEALPIATQIAEALEAAHEQGIIHRDLKPANVKLRPDGTVKVLDFGLAKALEPASGLRPDVTASPTITTPAMTMAGVILGTAAYMSPEQAKGRPADKRSDIWAFGCVLYEMLTGKRAFEGEDVSDTLAAVLRGEPDWKALPRSVPAPIRTILPRCLDKNRQTRFAEIAIVQFLLNEGAAVATSAPHGQRGFRALGPIAAAVAVTGLFAGAVTWAVARRPTASPRPVRFAIVPVVAPLNMQAGDRNLAISPDGTHLVYRVGSAQVGSAQGQLAVRALDELEPRLFAGVTGIRSPFISPDGHWVGFFTIGELKKVAMTGGPPITLCHVSAAPRGASWGPDNVIVFATSDITSGLLSVPADGGEPKTLTRPDHTHGEQDHLFPSVLPGGQAVLFTISAGQPENAQIAVLDLKTGQRKTVIRGRSAAEYVDTGHLVYAAGGTLWAVRFNLSRLEVTSDPVPVVEQVMTWTNGAGDFAISRQGTLVYVPGTGPGGAAQRSLIWITRQGREEPTKAPVRAYGFPRLSPDGTRAALDVRDQQNDVWVWDFARESMTRLTFDPAADVWPIWTPDGRRIVFTSARAGVPNLYWRAADGTGSDERLTTSPNDLRPDSFTPDGKMLVVEEAMPKTGIDINVLRMGSKQTEPLISTRFNEHAGEISPDGQWIAYYSDESGQYEVYVRPFPKVDTGRWQISTAGGTRPAWARSGKELFYLAGNAMMSVSVQTSPTFLRSNPTKLFEGPFVAAQTGRSYDVSADGQRFLMIKNSAATDQTKSAASLIVVEHWTEELMQRVPTK